MTIQANNNVQAYLFALIAQGATYNDIAHEWETQLRAMGASEDQARRLGVKMAGHTFRAFDMAYEAAAAQCRRPVGIMSGIILALWYT